MLVYYSLERWALVQLLRLSYLAAEGLNCTKAPHLLCSARAKFKFFTARKLQSALLDLLWHLRLVK